MNLDVDTMSTRELKDIVKMLARNLNQEHDRLTLLQDRVLQLEILVKAKQNSL